MADYQEEHPPPCLVEHYGRAVVSSHLRLEEGRCDIDYLMAAGMAVDGMGAALLRLRGEFDSAKAQLSQPELNRTEFALLLSQMKSLPGVRRELGSFACVLATKQVFMQADGVVMAIAGRVLDVWLDPTCQACDGRGFNGGTHRGEQKVRCGGCRGLGQRRALLGDTAEEKRFARLLFDAMGEVLRNAEDQMRFKLRNDLTA